MKQIKTEGKTQTGDVKYARSTMSMIMCALGRVSTALKPANEDLNFSRWQELECRDYRASDRFDQIHDRRFK